MNISDISGKSIAGMIVENERSPEQVNHLSTQPETPKTLLGDSSVRVVTPTDLNALIDTLKAEYDNQKRDMMTSRLANAINIINNSVLVNEQDKEILKEIDEKAKQMEADNADIDSLMADIEALKGQLSGKNAEIEILELKTKELEAAIERYKKTPEDQRTEQQKKELAEAEAEKEKVDKQLNDAVTARDKIADEIMGKGSEVQSKQQEINSLSGQIGQLYVKLTSNARDALAEALKHAVDKKELQFNDPKDGKKTDAPDALDTLLSILSGEKLTDVIEEKRPIKA